MEINNFIKEKSYSLPFTEQDLTEAYNLGRQEVINELITKIIGYPVGGVVQGMVSENVLKEYKKELTKKKK